ncbi:thymidine phosphorylase [Tropicimonas isoalkanivorans]|uniref:Thymidine phosphorylase n=1 Tax=Tropicimonas isoalkanivorans TaxID=441112 RepID=A0A1I1QPF0_9RHOB|nr:thymidine phosphorylase [Tropicimonas isoalkanivorans]SFD23905.1 thymidine phosphorylase [Tropicimonas isoalkanivorans]
MDAKEILAVLRQGGDLSPEQTAWFGAAIGSGGVTDAQVGAFAMGVCRAPLPVPARVALTEAMRDSGQVMGWDMPGPVLDKHSTGGVGDSVSLPLAPALAACGAYVPMISGRGLGHTGGTLDKLEAIPGYTAEVPQDRLRQIVADVGCAIVGASGDIAPSDKRLYAIRDVTGTVESIDLITASILSKKLAAGLEGLVLDVKVGSGAFMPDAESARALAESLVNTANGAGCRTEALITDMSQPLMESAGNALEVAEVMRTLTGEGIAEPLWKLTVDLGGVLLAIGGLADDSDAGAAMIEEALKSGRAVEGFERMIAALGGPSDFVGGWRRYLPEAPVIRDIFPEQAGTVQRVDTRAVGMAVVHLGGGRLREGDVLDPSVGFDRLATIGTAVSDAWPLARVHAATEDAAGAAAAAIRAAYVVGDGEVSEPPLVHERIAP